LYCNSTEAYKYLETSFRFEKEIVIILYRDYEKKWWVIIIVTVLLLALALVLGNFFGVPSKFFRAAVDFGPRPGENIFQRTLALFTDLYTARIP
jgi:hypothetical protein